MLTERTIERFSQTSTVDDGKRSGRPRGVQTNTTIKAQCQALFEMNSTWKPSVNSSPADNALETKLA